VNGNRQTRRRPASHIEIVPRQSRVKAGVEICGDLIAAGFIALRGRIAVKFHRGRLRDEAANRLLHAGGRGYGRISDGKIENVFRADLSRATFRVFKNFTYRRTLAAEFVHLFVDHGIPSAEKF